MVYSMQLMIEFNAIAERRDVEEKVADSDDEMIFQREFIIVRVPFTHGRGRNFGEFTENPFWSFSLSLGEGLFLKKTTEVGTKGTSGSDLASSTTCGWDDAGASVHDVPFFSTARAKSCFLTRYPYAVHRTPGSGVP